jgi:hypothetical protein
MSFTLYWENGTKETVVGADIETAFRNAGHDESKIKDLSWYSETDKEVPYSWNKEKTTWTPAGI